MKPDCTFWLGYQGQLKVVGLISETGLSMTWDREWVERVRRLLELKPGGRGVFATVSSVGKCWVDDKAFAGAHYVTGVICDDQETKGNAAT